MISKFTDFKDTLVERINSPFLGSFIVTWSLIHWKIFAFIIYDQENLTIESRVNLIQNYLIIQTCDKLIIYPICITFLALILYNLLNLVGLGIKLLYDEWGSPLLIKKFSNKRIIDKSRFDKIQNELLFFKEKYESESETFIAADKRLREHIQTSEEFQKTAFAGSTSTHLLDLFGKEEIYLFTIYSEGNKEEVNVQINFEGIQFPTLLVKVKNVKYSRDNTFVRFEKHINNSVIVCNLIRNKFGDFYGIEDYQFHVSYIRISEINSLKKTL